MRLRSLCVLVMTSVAVAGEPLVQQPDMLLSQAVESGMPIVNVTTSGEVKSTLKLKPGQKLVCSEGVTITCEWATDGNCVELADNVTVTGCSLVGVWKGDPKAPVSYRQGMHGIAAYGVQGWVVDRCTMTGFHGDGFYAGPKTPEDRTPAKGIVSDSKFIGNYRTGVGLVSAVVKLLRVTASGTIGAPTQAGFLVEPSNAGDSADVRIEECVADGNRGSPFMIALARTAASSPPPVVRFIGCRALNTPVDTPDLRLSEIQQPNGFPLDRLPKGTLVTWDGLTMARKP